MGNDVMSKFIDYLSVTDSLKDKIRMKKLYSLYDSLNKKNYTKLEKELYGTGDVRFKFELELNRIFIFLSKNNVSAAFKQRYLELYEIYQTGDFDYDKIFIDIINLELDLNMPIGLYEEARNYFLQTLDKTQDDYYGFDITIIDQDGRELSIETKKTSR